MEQFNSILIEFKEFTDCKVKSMPEIEWWLLNYSEFYKKESEYYYSQYYVELPDGEMLRCAPILNPNHKEDFFYLYKALDKLSELHRNEKNCKEELNVYYKIKDSKIDLKKWVKKNEKFGSNELASFWVDYLDYSQNEEEIIHLSVYPCTKQKFEIFVQREDFKNLIEYKELFDELYYMKKILPEGLKRIEEEMNKLPKYINE